MDGISAKKASINRQKRLEILRLQSNAEINGLIDNEDPAVTKGRAKKTRPKENDGSDCGYLPLSSPSSSSSHPEGIPDGNIPIGILVTGGKVNGEDLADVPCLSHGSVSVCGRRVDMEDAVTVAPGLIGAGDENRRRYDFFGVYDGHGGYLVAHACRDRLHQVLAKEVEERNGGTPVGLYGADLDWEEIMEGCFAKMDEEVGGVEEKSTVADSMKTIGSTAVVVLVGTENVIVANCGDSRAVLSQGGVALPLSRDHKPDRPDEFERVESAGGRVIDWNGYRVLGVLATSRSIGDRYLKPYVISKPEVTIYERTASDEFLILASDGLWDVLSNGAACDVARRCLAGQGPKKFAATVNRGGAAEAVAALAELAMSRGSRDNISVVVVELNKPR